MTDLHLLIVSTDHGDTPSLHETEEAAQDELYSYVSDFWDQDGPGRTGVKIPDDHEAAIEDYFEAAHRESYTVAQVPAPTVDLATQLRALKAAGLTFGQIVPVYAEDNTPRQQALIEKARKQSCEGELEFDDVTITSGSSDRGDYVLGWVWVADDANTQRFRARFTPEAWIKDQAAAVDPQGTQEWDATDFVRAHWKGYFDLLMIDEDDSSVGVVDEDDMLRDDPAAPDWVREWQGPFTITVRSER